MFDIKPINDFGTNDFYLNKKFVNIQSYKKILSILVFVLALKNLLFKDLKREYGPTYVNFRNSKWAATAMIKNRASSFLVDLRAGVIFHAI